MEFYVDYSVPIVFMRDSVMNLVDRVDSINRVATAQGKQGIWFLLFPDRENTGNFALTQGKVLRHRENIFV